MTPVVIHGRSSLEFALQNFADKRGVGFAFAQFHHLAFEKIQRGAFRDSRKNKLLANGADSAASSEEREWFVQITTTRFSSRFSLVLLLGWLCALPNSNAGQVIVWGTFSDFYRNTSLTNVPPDLTNVVALAAGDAHCLALKADGTVVAWGANYVGQTNIPPNLTNVVSIAAGSSHGVALKKDGTLDAWGQFYATLGNITVPPEATNVAALALGPGAQHVLVLKADGTVFDWGSPDSEPGVTNIPAMARNIVAVASGATYGLALRADGKVVSWGSNAAPVPAAATNIVAIAASWSGNAALRADGTVLVWGQFFSVPGTFTAITDLACQGQSGDVLGLQRKGSLVDASFSLPAYPANHITAIAAGSYNLFALVGSNAPAFTGMPVNRTVATGSRAYFRAVAAGAMPISYQWTCNGADLPGYTNTVLVLTNVQPEQTGNYYSLIASNALGEATNGAMFLHEVPLEFSIQPANLSIALGAMAQFTIAYTNGVGPFTFRWQFNHTNLDGATNAFLALTNVQLNQAGTYSLVMGNGYGSVTNTAALTVLPMVFNAGSTNVTMTTNGLQLELDSVYATNSVVIFASTDLVSWLPVFTNLPATGSVLFLDSSATNMPQRFYRATEQ